MVVGVCSGDDNVNFKFPLKGVVASLYSTFILCVGGRGIFL